MTREEIEQLCDAVAAEARIWRRSNYGRQLDVADVRHVVFWVLMKAAAAGAGGIE